MEGLLRHLSLSSNSHKPVKSQGRYTTAVMESSRRTLLDLPSEIIDCILTYLPPLTLIDLTATCHLLRTHALNDLLWAPIANENIPVPQTQPLPFETWKDLYITHHPYWFIPKHKLWYSDKAHTGSTLVGQLIVARYDGRTGCIEAYRLVAQHDSHTVVQWDLNNEVLIHTFNPKIALFLDDPVVRIEPGATGRRGRLQEEVGVHQGTSRAFGGGIRATLSLCRPIAPELQHPSMELWPPKTIPAAHRVRNDPYNLFHSNEYRPRTLTEASDATFRLRKWMEFRGLGQYMGLKMGEDVMTFATMPSDLYMPTKGKPWRGIWVGDYAGHGCEFLVILQRDLIESENTGEPVSQSSFESEPTFTLGGADIVQRSGEEEDPPGCTGRLEAIKLTGDPNIPRGEYTWIAPDIGHRGFVRLAHEQMFKGARVVSSYGHIASAGFKEGECTMS